MLANILGTIQAPTTVTNTTNESPLSVLQQGQSLLSSMGQAGGLSGISSSLGSLLSNAINGNSTTPPTENGLNTTVEAPTGALTDANGNPLTSVNADTGPAASTASNYYSNQSNQDGNTSSYDPNAGWSS